MGKIRNGIPESRWVTRSPLGIGLRLYFLSPLEIGMGLGYPNFTGLDLADFEYKQKKSF
jgi:hypothetical protein